MGRGRRGLMDQSLKKPKIGKNQERGPDFEIFHSPYKRENYPLLLSEDVIAEMKKMSPQNLMNILLPNKNVNREGQQVYTPNMVSGSNNCQLNEYTKKLRQRAALGWDKVHQDLQKTPFCHRRERLVKVMFCLEHKNCGVDGICVPCIRKDSIRHRRIQQPQTLY